MRSCAFGVAEIELLERGGPLAVAVVRGALGRNARRRLARTWRLSRRMSSAQPFGSSCSRSSGSVKARRGLAKRCFGGRETSATRVEMSLEGSGELLWGSIAVDRPRISIERPTDQPKASTDQPRTQAGSTSNTYGSASNIDGSTSNADRINLKHRPDQHQTTTTDQPSASNERLAPSMDLPASPTARLALARRDLDHSPQERIQIQAPWWPCYWELVNKRLASDVG